MKRGLLFLGLVLLFPFHLSATGSPTPSADVQNQPGLTLDQAVRKVQRETGGRILAADAVLSAGGPVYRIKVLLPSGRVKVIQVDARR
jgi:uncharacterized membrane protein YkoI